MPESPLVQKETVALSDLEALIAARYKGETETETGFRKRIDREEAEYKATAKHQGDKYKVDSTAMEAEYSRARDTVVQTFQRDTQATKNEYEQKKKENDEQLKKDSRRAKKTKEEAGWQALAMFEGQRDEGIKWRRGTDAKWNEELAFLQQKQADAEWVLKRCGRMANVPPGGDISPPKPPESDAPADADGAQAENSRLEAKQRRHPPRMRLPRKSLRSSRCVDLWRESTKSWRV